MRLRIQTVLSGLFLGVLWAPSVVQAQNPPQETKTPRAEAPFDPTGYWVSIVTEDWRFRMVTPAKGDYASVPLNAEGKRIAGTWDPGKDEASGEQCRSYGAPALMRIPGRIHVSWQDDQTLKIETDAGTQTRIFNFSAPKNQPGGWQGISTASWDLLPQERGGRGSQERHGSLRVVTSGIRAGYLRKNGVPYSANAKLTEFYDRVEESNGDSWLIIQTIVEDPAYLNQKFITSTNFKKQADASGWDPTPCTALLNLRPGPYSG